MRMRMLQELSDVSSTTDQGPKSAVLVLLELLPGEVVIVFALEGLVLERDGLDPGTAEPRGSNQDDAASDRCRAELCGVRDTVRDAGSYIATATAAAIARMGGLSAAAKWCRAASEKGRMVIETLHGWTSTVAVAKRRCCRRG